MTKKLLIFAFVLSLVSCKDEHRDTNARPSYFDLKSYFAKEIAGLQRRNPDVDKTVKINDNIEKKKVKVQDWQKELAVFENADINKASWQGEFKVESIEGTTIYTSSNKKIPIKKLAVTQFNNHLEKIEVIIDRKNILFQSSDTIIYIPGKYYQIKKLQRIRFLKEKNYQIIGELK